MIKNYIKMKKAEFKVKATLYGTIASMMDSYKEYMPALKSLADFAKDYQGADFQNDFIGKLAEVIHYDVNGKE